MSLFRVRASGPGGGGEGGALPHGARCHSHADLRAGGDAGDGEGGYAASTGGDRCGARSGQHLPPLPVAPGRAHRRLGGLDRFMGLVRGPDSLQPDFRGAFQGSFRPPAGAGKGRGRSSVGAPIRTERTGVNLSGFGTFGTGLSPFPNRVFLTAPRKAGFELGKNSGRIETPWGGARTFRAYWVGLGDWKLAAARPRGLE